MNTNAFLATASNTVMAAVMGYFVSLGLTFDTALEAAKDPMGTNWEAVGEAVVKTAFKMNEDVTPYIEGPVNDFVKGTKKALIKESQTIDLKQFNSEYF